MKFHECALSPLTERAEPKHCVWCGSPLMGRQLRWCSQSCVDTYLDNHEWSSARRKAATSAIFSDEPRLYQCDQCGGLVNTIEINHVEPRVGRGYGKGCWNHQTNLQPLCHDCHSAETARQKRERIAGVWPGLTPKWTDAFATWAEAERFIEHGRAPAQAVVDGQRSLGLDA